MIRSARYLIVLLFLLSIFQSCDKEESKTQSCPYFLIGKTRFLTAPDSVKTDSKITIFVIPDEFNKCQQFFSFASNSSNNIETVIMQTIMDTCNCPNQATPYSLSYQYQAPHLPGQSIIRVFTNNNYFNADTIVVY